MGNSQAHAKMYVTNKQNINTTMQQIVNASSNVNCTNLQKVSGVQGCSITFAPQFCEAIAIGNVSTLGDFSAVAIQDMANSIKQSAEAVNEGLNVLQNSNASTVMTLYNNMSIDTLQTFNTDCSKNISALNAQIVENSSCGSKDKIRFSDQVISLEVIGDCVATAVARSNSSQKLVNQLDQKAKALNKGLSLWAIVVIGLILLAFMLVAPIGIRILTKPHAKPQSNQTDAEVQNEKTKQGSMYIIFFVVFLALVWYPGLGAYFLGVTPWQHTVPENDRGEPFCRKSELVDPNEVINKFMFWDELCTVPSDANLAGQACTDEARQVSYKTCGLFMDGGCDDPDFLTNKTAYTNMYKACSDLRNMEETVEYCTPEDLAASFFAQDYEGCKRCDDPDSGLWRTFVGDKETNGSGTKVEIEGALYDNIALDLACRVFKICNDEEQKKADDIEYHTCDATNISLTAYWNQDPDGCQAGAEIGHCFSDPDQLLAVSPNDCLNPQYQARKREFSKMLRKCDTVLANTVIPDQADGKPGLLAEMCPPNVYDYFDKCDPSTDECRYVATGCTGCDADGNNCDCSGANPTKVKSCRNDFEGCDDVDYVTDYNKWRQSQDLCEARWKQVEDLNKIIPLASGISYGVLIIGAFATYFVGRRVSGYNGPNAGFWGGANIDPRTGYATNMTGGTSGFKAWLANSAGSWFLIFVLFGVWLAVGPPFGLLGSGYGMPPLYKKDPSASMKNYDQNSALTQGWIWTGVVTFILGMVIFFKFYFRRSYRMLSPGQQSNYGYVIPVARRV